MFSDLMFKSLIYYELNFVYRRKARIQFHSFWQGPKYHSWMQISSFFNNIFSERLCFHSIVYCWYPWLNTSWAHMSKFISGLLHTQTHTHMHSHEHKGNTLFYYLDCSDSNTRCICLNLPNCILLIICSCFIYHLYLNKPG